MMEKIICIKNKYLKVYFINFIAVIVFWGGLLGGSFVNDTIVHAWTKDADVLIRLQTGRYIIALCDWILLKFGIRTTTNISVSVFIALLLLALSMSVMWIIFETWIPEEKIGKIVFWIGLNLVFLNVLFSEVLMFSEVAPYFAFGYCVAAYSVLFFSKHQWIRMVCTLFIAAFTYQYTVVFAAVLCIAYILFDEKFVFSLKLIIRSFISAGLFLSMGLMNLISIKLLEYLKVLPEFPKGMGRIISISKIQELLNVYIEYFRNSQSIFPDEWIPAFFFVAFMTIFALSAIKKKKYSSIVAMLFGIVCAFGIVGVIPLLSEPLYMPPRMSFCIYLIQGMLMMGTCYMCETLWKKCSFYAAIGYIMLQFLFINRIISYHYLSNSLDILYTDMVYERIEEYESETGTTVEIIAWRGDIHSRGAYDEIAIHTYQINERAVGLISKAFLDWRSGREFTKVDMPDEIYEEYFGGKDWEGINLDEQLKFDGNILYWCVF